MISPQDIVFIFFSLVFLSLVIYCVLSVIGWIIRKAMDTMETLDDDTFYW